MASVNAAGRMSTMTAGANVRMEKHTQMEPVTEMRTRFVMMMTTRMSLITQIANTMTLALRMDAHVSMGVKNVMAQAHTIAMNVWSSLKNPTHNVITSLTNGTVTTATTQMMTTQTMDKCVR
jgi:hypothetical protein